MPEVRRLLAIAWPLPMRSPELRLAWSTFREAGSGSGPVEAIPDDARSGGALVHALMRLYNYGSRTKRWMESVHACESRFTNE